MATEVVAARAESPQNEELLYAAVVQILSEDLYPRKLEIIREYIQNASDAIDDWLRLGDLISEDGESQIKISIQGRSLLIFDTGIGMTAEDIPKLKRIAYSEKKTGEEAGYKGIGRLAGIAVADKLKITTTSYGDPRLHHFEFRAADMRRDISEKKRQNIQEPASPVINRHTEIWWTDVDPTDHYTLVEIRDIKESCADLLDPDKLIEFIGDIGPVDFSPKFSHGAKVSKNLARRVPDYSPKNIYLSKSDGNKVKIYKPYVKEMSIAEPGFLDIPDPDNPTKLLAYCWYASNAEEILGEVRPTGKIFEVEGEKVEDRRRFAGLAYKLFGFTIGDRSLPMRTLWTTALPRALWFTGEIHVVDKAVMPTTDRSNFIENEARLRLYEEAAERITSTLKDLAQEISDNRKAFQDARKFKQKIDSYKSRLENGGIERADLSPIREDLEKEFKRLRDRTKRCTDDDIKAFQREVQKTGTTLQNALNDPKNLKAGQAVADLAADLQMTSKARTVFKIVMETLQQHYARDKDEYHLIASEIYKALKDKY